MPTVLSLRTLAQLLKWAYRSDSESELAAFFNMVDRRKALHRRAREWSAGHPGVLLAGEIPYASVVEQMSVRRMPLAVFAARDPATSAFTGIWAEVHTCLQQRKKGSAGSRDRWAAMFHAIVSLIARLESTDRQEPAATVRVGERHMGRVYSDDAHSRSSSTDSGPTTGPALQSNFAEGGDVHFVHSFDTDGRDLLRSGYVLELRERPGSFLVVAARTGEDNDRTGVTGTTHMEIDREWAGDILSGLLSPLAALVHRLGQPMPSLVEQVRVTVGERKLRRIASYMAGQAGTGEAVTATAWLPEMSEVPRTSAAKSS